LNQSLSQSSSLTDLINSGNQLSQIQANLTNVNSISLQYLTTQYTLLQADLSSTGIPSDSNSAYNILNEFRKYTDVTVGASYINGCDSQSPSDIIVGGQSACAGYNHISGNSGTANIGVKDCLVFSEWSSSSITQRYNSALSSCTNTGGAYTNALNAINAYFPSLSTYSTSNTQLLSDLITRNTQINSSYQNLVSQLKTPVDNALNIVKPLLTILNFYMGNGGFTDIINCHFVISDLNYFMEVDSNDFSPSSIKLGVCMGISGTFIIFMIFFQLCSILRLNKPSTEKVHTAESEKPHEHEHKNDKQ